MEKMASAVVLSHRDPTWLLGGLKEIHRGRIYPAPLSVLGVLAGGALQP
jgi:hypothetical protein